MYAILVLQLGYNPEYVLDKMSMIEARVAIKYSYYAHKDTWESARVISYLIAQVNSRKKLKPEEILPLSWDKKHEQEGHEMTQEEREQLNKKAEQLKKLLAD